MDEQARSRAEIAALLERQMAAWAAGDADAFSEDVADDVVFTNIVGMFVVGRAGFRAAHAHIFSTFYANSVMRQAVERLAFVRPDVAIVNTQATVEGGGPFPPGFPHDEGPIRTRLEQVMVREAGRWGVVAFHNVPIPPGGEAGAA